MVKGSLILAINYYYHTIGVGLTNKLCFYNLCYENTIYIYYNLDL